MSEQITTAAELDALPVGSVVRDAYGEVREKFQLLPSTSVPVWLAPFVRVKRDERAMVKRGPLTLLFRPDAPVAAGATVTREQVANLVEAALRLIGEAWDDGNAAGLDGWTGPGRGSGEVDWEAQHARTRMVHKADAVLTALCLTVADGPTEGGA